MVPCELDSSGNCTSCNTEGVLDTEILQCRDCKTYYHAVCPTSPFTNNRSFLSNFKKASPFFNFICPHCTTKWETNEASDLKNQLSELTATVTSLATEFRRFKEENAPGPTTEPQLTELTTTVTNLASEFSTFRAEQALPATTAPETAATVWQNPKRTNQMRSSLCIKSKGNPIDMKKIEEIVKTNNIQVTKAEKKQNGDVYVNLPSEENREKLIPLLEEESFAQNEVVTLKSKLPAISVLGVETFTSKEGFIVDVMKQNQEIKERIEQGSECSVVFAKEPREGQDQTRKSYYQIVVRVSEDIRRILRRQGDKLFLGVTSHRIVDRFFVKRCNKCQEFGHYEKDCEKETCCGYCKKDHKSNECNEVEPGDHANYNCINCEKGNKQSVGHSSLWHKCPSFLDQQKKVKKSIPYYDAKNE